jgi:beta-glucosidase
VDRPDLSLDHHADALISAVSAVAKRTVVLLQVPGAVLTPWRDSVDSIAVQFLGGEATGLAWGGFLFGDSPQGHLPITFPGGENDDLLPSPREHVRYAEGMESGYRNTTMLQRAAFPFGHGLSYGRFQVEQASEVACDEAGSRCISATVKNHGPHRASALVQLYLQMPNCGLASAVLKGWSRTTEIAVGEAAAVYIALTEDAFQCWSADKGGWVVQREARAHVGFSSTDLQATLELASAPIMV